MKALMERAQSEEPWKRVLEACNKVYDGKMKQGQHRLEDLLGAGEIRKLDEKLVKMVNKGETYAGFILVLNQNIAAAQAENDETKLNILTHISTRMQEELEKRTKPGAGILHKLMRTDDKPLRGRILEHYLTPQTSIGLPDGKTIKLEKPNPAMVEPMQFSEAVTELVGQLRGMDVDGNMIRGMIEDVRQVSIEARAVIMAAYPDSVVDEFSEALTPTFQGTVPAAPQSS